jgi:hypothetical protein
MEGGSGLDIPIRALASVPAPNSIAGLLVLSRPNYRCALDMVQEYVVRCAVNRCCRLPFLRHTPLKVCLTVLPRARRLKLPTPMCFCCLNSCQDGQTQLDTFYLATSTLTCSN